MKGKLSDQPLPKPSIQDLLVYVVWEDAMGVTQDWTDLDELERLKTCLCHSVGALICNEETHIVVVPHFGTGPYAGCGDMVIPRTQIRDIHHLKPTKRVKL